MKCIQCGRIKTVRAVGDGTYHCQHCGAHFDDDPDEGGTHHSRDVSRRLTRAEDRLQRRLAR